MKMMKMGKRTAEILVKALSVHPGIIPVDKGFFIDSLKKIKIPTFLGGSKRFYIKLPDKQQILNEIERYHCLSIGRILLNDNAYNYKLSGIKKVWESFVKRVGYSSDVFTRNLRLNETIVTSMYQSAQPFSLLAKFETFDYNSLTQSTMPILIIPGVDYNDRYGQAVLSWEQNNAVYEKEVGLFFRHFKKISLKTYLSY